MCYIYPMRSQKGQNIVEYLLLVVAVLAVMILFLKPQGKYKKAVEHIVLNSTNDKIKNLTDEIKF